MALAETAQLAVRLTLDDRMSPAIRKAQGGLRTLGNTARTVGKGVAVGLGIGAAAGIVALTGAIHSGLEALKADKVVAAQTAAVIKSTGGAAGVSAKQVDELAQKLSILDGVQDDVVGGAENLLLTFTNIGANIFPDATAAALDMAAALGTDANSAAKTLGKALQDPIKGMTNLRRVGVILSDEQQAHIKHLIKIGDLYGAQRIILDEVAKKYGNVAKAQADADPGRRLAVSVERFQKALATGLLPVIEKVQTRLTEWLSKPETLAAIRRLGDTLGALFTDQNLDTIASGLETAAKAVSVAISAFNSLPPEIKALAIGAFAINKVTGGAVGGLAEGFGKLLGAGLQKIFAANVTVIGTNVIGGGGGLPGIGGKIGAGEAAGGAVAGIGLGTIGVAAVAAVVVPLAINEMEKSNVLITPARSKFGLVGPNSGGTKPIAVNGTGNFFGRVGAILRSTVVAATDRGNLRTAALQNRLAERQRSLQQRIRQAQEAGDRGRASRLQGRLDRVIGRLDAINSNIKTLAENPSVGNWISVRDVQTGQTHHNKTHRKSSSSSGDSRTYSGNPSVGNWG